MPPADAPEIEVVWVDPTLRSGYTYSPGPALQDMAAIADGGGHSWALHVCAHPGGDQGTATRMRAGINIIDDVINSGDSVALPPATGGQIIYVENQTANAATVYTAFQANDAFNGVSGNMMTLAAQSAIVCISVPHQWTIGSISLASGGSVGGDFLPLSGGTLTGGLQISNPISGTPQLYLDAGGTNWSTLFMNTAPADITASPNTANYIRGMKNGLNRWTILMPDTEGETGGNVGSDFRISRSDDSGNPIQETGAPAGTSLVQLVRSTGEFQYWGPQLTLWQAQANVANAAVRKDYVDSGFLPLVGVSLVNAASDAAAASAGVPLNGLYRNGNAVQVRLT